jgi:hypothetical protein
VAGGLIRRYLLACLVWVEARLHWFLRLATLRFRLAKRLVKRSHYWTLGGSAMTSEDMIRDFATTGCDLPRASMRWALDHWDEAGPALIALLDRYTSGEDRSEGTRDALLFAVHLLGQRAEAGAFPALCRLMRATEACEAALGDATTETLPQIIVSTYDGNLATLQGVIEDADADEFVRHGAMMAMAYLTRTGRIPDAEMRAYLPRLYSEMQPQSHSFVWAGWVEAVVCLGYGDYAEMAERLLRRRFVDRFTMTVEEFRDDLRRTLADPNDLSGFESDRIAPFGDAIATLAQWYYFTEKYKKDQAREAARRAVDEKYRSSSAESPYSLYPTLPHINEFRHVGRNDQCPCGSGKKFKKCCLPENSGAMPLSAAQ